MKKLTYIFLSLLVLAGCTTRQEYATMREGLDSINERNRNDEPFTANDVQPYVDYFDRHGEPNDRMLAHYLLGRAYHEHGEAPMALQCYQQAIECADTLSADCDFAQMSRVYAQMGDVFYEQSLYKQQLHFFQLAEKTAIKGKDTLAAIIMHEQQSVAYRELLISDSSVYVIEQTAKMFILHGYDSDAAIALGSIARTLLNIECIEKAKKYMQTYEAESGLFNEAGEIEEGREAYYNTKGLLYLKENKLDSAEYWYRKELTDGKDFNNQNGGALGLAMVYEQRHQPDSAAKYYQYAYAMNDSMYAQMTTSEVERMQAMYDYTRHQEIARKESEKALLERNKWLLTMLLLLFCVSVASFIIYNLHKEKKESKKRYAITLEKLERTQSEMLQLRDMASDFSDLKSFVEEKEQEIEHLKSLLRHDQQKTIQSRAIKEEQISNSKIRKSLLRKSRNGIPLSNEELRTCRMMVIESLPELNNLLLLRQNDLNKKEFDLCVLFRLGFLSKETSNILKVSPARISQMSTSVLKKLFKLNEGGAKELIAKLCEYY